MKKIVFALAAMLIIISTATAEQRYFGYFANGHVEENYDHTNVTHIWAGYDDQNVATQQILSQLNMAKSYGVKAIVSVESFVFHRNKGCPFSYQPAAAQNWQAFMQTLVNNGYIIPGNPAASTVLAFYPVDEPELCGLKDSGGQPHPALTNAVQTIRNHPISSAYPIAVISSKKYGNAIQGIRLFDWAGMDNYDVSTNTYLSQFMDFQGQLLPMQRTMLVPQASKGGMMKSYGDYMDPSAIFYHFESNSRSIAIIPFLWEHGDTTGVRDITELRTAYTAIGKHIVLGGQVGPIPLNLNAQCSGSGGLFECHASVSGGTEPYSITWNTSGAQGIFTTFYLTCGIPQDIDLSVQDATGATSTATTSVYCDPDTVPR